MDKSKKMNSEHDFVMAKWDRPLSDGPTVKYVEGKIYGLGSVKKQRTKRKK